MIASRTCLFLGLSFLILASGVLVWGVWPNPVTQKLIQFQGGELVVSWPSTLRKGDPGEVSLTLVLDEGWVVNRLHMGHPEISYSTVSTSAATHVTSTILAQARLEFVQAVGVDDETIRQVYNPGQSANFRWNLRPHESGNYNGTLWLYLQSSRMENNPNKSESLPALKPVYNQQLDVEVTDLWELGGSSARVFGVTGGIVGMGLCLGAYFLRKDSLKEQVA